MIHTGHRWRALRFAVVVSVLVAAAGWASTAVDTCIGQSCRSGRRACAAAFRRTKQGTLVACAQVGARATKRTCRNEVRHAFRAGIESCRRSMRACAACCRESGASCHVGVCGNAFIEAGEACDGAALGACPDGCRADCTCERVLPSPICGNATRESDEECDGTDDAACPGACRADCTCSPPVPPVCGNGVLEAREICEPGTSDSVCPDRCLPDCTCAVCGDGVIEAPIENCESTDDAACPGSCSPSTCTCPSPTTDICEEPHRIDAFPAVDRQDTTTATSAPGDPAFACTGDPSQGDHSVWYVLTAPATGRIRADTAASTFDTLLAAYAGTCSELQPIACSYLVDERYRGRIDFPVSAGADYLIEAAGYAGDLPGELVLAVDFVPCGDGIVDPGEECDPAADTCSAGACSPDCECLAVAADECADAATAIELPIAVTLAAWGSTGDAADPKLACARQPVDPSPSAWFRFRAPLDGIVDIDTIGSDYDTVLGVFTGDCGALTPVTCDDDGGGGLTSFVSLPVSGGVDYTLVVTPWYLVAPSRLALSIAYEPPAP